MELPDRIFDKIHFEPNTGCWLWMAAKTSSGYGNTWVNGRNRLAHRYVYEFLVGPIPNGLVLDHLCRVRACCNPQHLHTVTQRTNALENSVGVTARNAVATHCAHGHPFDERNTYHHHGRRCCRRCNMESVYAYKRKMASPA